MLTFQILAGSLSPHFDAIDKYAKSSGTSLDLRSHPWIHRTRATTPVSPVCKKKTERKKKTRRKLARMKMGWVLGLRLLKKFFHTLFVLFAEFYSVKNLFKYSTEFPGTLLAFPPPSFDKVLGAQKRHAL